MFKISFLAVFFSLFTLNAFAQTRQMGLKAHIGYGRIAYRSPALGNPPAGNPHFSGNLGFWSEQQINSRSSWGIEFLLVQVKNTSRHENPVVLLSPQGTLVQTGYLTTNERSHISYFGIPAYYRYISGKWGLRAGVQILVPMFSATHTQISGTYQNQPYFYEASSKKAILNHLDIGPKIGIDYTLNSRLRLAADYYYGLVNIRTPDNLKASLSVRQMSLGLAYIF